MPCTICIQVYDNPDKKFRGERDYVSMKKWDVVDVQTYDFFWVDSEAMRKGFRILRLSNIPLTEMLDWLKPMKLYDIEIQRRMHYIDGECGEAKWLRDAVAMGYILELDLEEQESLRRLKRTRETPIPTLVLNGNCT